MKSIVVRIKEDDKARDLINFLQDINFIDIEEQEEISGDRESCMDGLTRLFGLWNDRNITLSDIRKKAWNYRGVHNDTA